MQTEKISYKGHRFPPPIIALVVWLYPRRNSGGAFEIGTAKFGHPVQHADANIGFCFLIVEGARLEL
jgi:hypothetical protein